MGDMNEIRKRLIQLRAERGETLAEVADVLHVTPTAVCNWEHRRCQYPVLVIKNLCKHYGVSADWVLGLTDERGKA